MGWLYSGSSVASWSPREEKPRLVGATALSCLPPDNEGVGGRQQHAQYPRRPKQPPAGLSAGCQIRWAFQMRIGRSAVAYCFARTRSIQTGSVQAAGEKYIRERDGTRAIAVSFVVLVRPRMGPFIPRARRAHGK
jgi:hypothetical protein